MKNHELDKVDESLLELLSTHARASYTELARAVGLSAPAVKERILKLEDAGIICGYRAELSQSRLGKAVAAFILVEVPYSREKQFIAFVRKRSDIASCHHLLGDSAFMLQVQLATLQDLESLLQACMQYGQTKTHMLLSKVK